MPDDSNGQGQAQAQTADDTTPPEPPHEHANRLINETSPYLLQHAHNPVDWYPWGEEAFEAARREQKPIFLSIGYSTCYWCHVMERECFENEDIAAQMNRDFICIKVDREERPDIDDIYMKAVQILNNGQGGWPASIFLTPPPPNELDPDRAWKPLQPFWAGTYFPPTPQAGRPSFPQVLGGIRRAWDEQPQEIVNQADLVASAVARELAAEHQPVPVDASVLENAVSALLRMYDEEHGGFGREPKFPQPVFLQLLLETRDSITNTSEQAAVDEAISMTLDHMAMGGIFDQIGGGFHRYSTDRMWRVPHFEKMLYDNGQLAWLYARAAEITDDPYYRRIAGAIGDYVLREMTDPETGAFYSAQDAEVDGREGLNYLWTAQSVRDALTQHGADETLVEFAMHAYGLNLGTNFRDPHHPNDPAMNVLYLTKHPEKLADELKLSREDVYQNLDRINAILLSVRNERRQPHLDDKVIASWNGFMIAGLAKAGAVLGREDLIDAAAGAWEYINAEMRVNDKNLLARSSRNGEINEQPAFCEDYAFLAHGLIELHRARHDDHRYLDDARNLMQRAHELFWDDQAGGGYFDTLADQRDLFVRSKSTYDGAVPSANSVMLHNLIDLYQETGENTYLDDAIATLKASSPDVRERSVVASNSTRALARLLEIAPERVESLGPKATTGIREHDAPNPNEDQPVQVQTSTAQLTVGPSQPAAFTVTLHIRDGFHVNAHNPGDPNLRGLNIDMVGGRGLVLGVGYPTGEAFAIGDQEIRVHGPGQLTLNVELSQNEPVARGPVKLVLNYQACTNEACLEPREVELPVTVELVDGK